MLPLDLHYQHTLARMILATKVPWYSCNHTLSSPRRASSSSASISSLSTSSSSLCVFRGDAIMSKFDDRKGVGW